VYKLYGLTPDEVKIVEQGGNESASVPDADAAPGTLAYLEE